MDLLFGSGDCQSSPLLGVPGQIQFLGVGLFIALGLNSQAELAGIVNLAFVNQVDLRVTGLTVGAADRFDLLETPGKVGVVLVQAGQILSDGCGSFGYVSNVAFQ